MLASKRHGFAFGGLPIAVLENDFRSAFHQNPLHAALAFVERGHEFVLRLKRDGIDAGICLLLRTPI
jgi:hypothetical protein